MRRLSLALLGLWLLPALVHAQAVELQVDRAPYYVGTPIEVVVVAEGFDADPEPVSEAPQPSSGNLTLVGVTPNQSSSVVIINGQVQRSSSVKFAYRYQYLASEPGDITIGPFRVRQGATVRSTASYKLEVRDVPRTERASVSLQLGTDTTYVGSRVPVVIEYRIEADLQRDLVRYTLQVPAVDLPGAFRIEPGESSPDGQVVEIATSNGTLELPARVREERRDGRGWLVISVAYSMLPLEPGSYALAPASLTVDAGTRFARDFFGGRRAAQIEKLRAVDVPRKLLVKAIPREGQPPSFAGAVGRGFSLDVRADRSVVQVGDPIQLTLTLRGDGMLETAALPPLLAPGLLPDRDFSVPDGELTGQVNEDAKTFTAVVRAKRAGVTEIPALAYTYFDPQTQRFETVQSRPIALAVRPAQIVDATRVIVPTLDTSEPPEASESEADVPSPEPRAPAGRGFELRGLDLSIVREPERLLRSAGGGSSVWLAGGIYTLSSVLLLGALWDRRRRRADPEIGRRRAARKAQLELAERAAQRHDLQGLRELASVLREIRAELSGARASELDAMLADCDESLFAPAGRSGEVSKIEALSLRCVERVRRIAAEEA